MNLGVSKFIPVESTPYKPSPLCIRAAWNIPTFAICPWPLTLDSGFGVQTGVQVDQEERVFSPFIAAFKQKTTHSDRVSIGVQSASK
jgi:hypothetical protein